MDIADLRGVLAASRGAVQISRQHRAGIGDPELPARVGDSPFGYVCQIGEERAQEADGDKLEGEAEAQVIGPASTDERLVLVVEVEETGELLLAGLARVAAVGSALVVDEKAYGRRSCPRTHDRDNSQRRPGGSGGANGRGTATSGLRPAPNMGSPGLSA